MGVIYVCTFKHTFNYISHTHMKKSYKIEVECAACADKMEHAIAKVAGVNRANVNFLLQKLTLEFAEQSNPTEVMAEVLRVCRKVEPDCRIEF